MRYGKTSDIDDHVDNLTNKIRELEKLTIQRKADIIRITQVSPRYTNEVISKQQFTLDGYDLYINIEEGEVARGVAVYIAKQLAVRAHGIKIDTDFKESVGVQINLCWLYIPEYIQEFY